MEGIYSTTVNRSTLDECALAYKPMDEIVNNIQDTVDIIEVIKPVYNSKRRSKRIEAYNEAVVYMITVFVILLM